MSLTDAIKAKISATHKAKWADPDWVEWRLSRCPRGHKRSEETKAKMRVAMQKVWGDPVRRKLQADRLRATIAARTPERAEEIRLEHQKTMQEYWDACEPKKAEEHKKKLSKNMGEKVRCPVCGLWGAKAIMGRWHGLDGSKCVPSRKTRKKKEQGL